ncbi:MAG TPA: rhomboid family intramembrane serine protease [Blastocatellia bacterium]|nr:rhomboid family intramembrane serine protease [Blastocatellia bacterium]
MLLPIGDDNQGRLTTPYVVYIIVAINVAIFLLQLSDDRFTLAYSAVPYKLTHNVTVVPTGFRGALRPGAEEDPRIASGMVPVRGVPQEPGPAFIWLTLLTSMFMHGGLMHIGGNMLYLWIFGDNIEDNFGHGKFLIFYLLCGLAASFAQIFVDPDSPIPSLGASGAIAGVLGAYLIMFPKNRVRNLVFLGFFFTTIELPAVVVLGFWIVLQIFSQYTATYQHASGGVAYMAHIGGFATGLVLCFLFRTRQRTSY